LGPTGGLSECPTSSGHLSACQATSSTTTSSSTTAQQLRSPQERQWKATTSAAETHSARWEGGVVQVGSEQDTGHQEDQSLHQLAVDSEPLANFLLAMTNAARQRRKTHFGSLVGGPWKITSLEETQLATKAAGS